MKDKLLLLFRDHMWSLRYLNLDGLDGYVVLDYLIAMQEGDMVT